MAVHSPEAPIRDAHARKSVSQMRTHTHAELEEAGCARWECHVGGAVRVMHQQGMRAPPLTPAAQPGVLSPCVLWHPVGSQEAMDTYASRLETSWRVQEYEESPAWT